MSNYKWESPEHFIACDIGEIVDQKHVHNQEVDEQQSMRTTMARRIGEDLYEVCRERTWGFDGDILSEHWKKNGEYHRLGGKPAWFEQEDRPYAMDEQGCTGVRKEEYRVEGKLIRESIHRQLPGSEAQKAREPEGELAF